MCRDFPQCFCFAQSAAEFWVSDPVFKRHFRVICVSYDGFDETVDTVFPNITGDACCFGQRCAIFTIVCIDTGIFL